ncbi:MAG: hypothetical protein WA240_13825 [Nitrospirota bacterium]
MRCPTTPFNPDAVLREHGFSLWLFATLVNAIVDNTKSGYSRGRIPDFQATAR